MLTKTYCFPGKSKRLASCCVFKVVPIWTRALVIRLQWRSDGVLSLLYTPTFIANVHMCTKLYNCRCFYCELWLKQSCMNFCPLMCHTCTHIHTHTLEYDCCTHLYWNFLSNYHSQCLHAKSAVTYFSSVVLNWLNALVLQGYRSTHDNNYSCVYNYLLLLIVRVCWYSCMHACMIAHVHLHCLLLVTVVILKGNPLINYNYDCARDQRKGWD